MYKQLFRNIKKRWNLPRQAGRKYEDINPEDIFLDSKNLPGFEEHRFEGKIEQPMGPKTFQFIKIALVLLVIALTSKLWILGIKQGSLYAQISENNRLEQTLVFANRGVIYDRNALELATNEIKEGSSDFAGRLYAPINGIAHIVGYLKYPQQDRDGVYYEEYYQGRDGVERSFDSELQGTNGLKLRETDALGKIISESVVEKPEDGKPLTLSIDARLSEVLYESMESLAKEKSFVGGAAVLMDVRTGEILTMTSYPEYDPNMITAGASQDDFNRLLNNPAKPFLNRAIGGLYSPGSILKPIIALAALHENIISPTKQILSTGSITVPNPYDATKPTIYGDWKAHGWTDMREALAVSSDTYFYAVGGGFGDQKGLGITLLDKYFQMFGINESTSVELGGELAGVIPTPEWKREKFNGEIWRLGDTYITSIGQFGTQMTPLNAARFMSAIANRGKLLKPSLELGGKEEPVERELIFNSEDWEVIHQGMRDSVTHGTSVGLLVPYVKAAAKTGTAEIGAADKYVHSWSVGFFPYDNPKYAWAVVMEKGLRTNRLGATSVVRTLFDWMSVNTPEYFE